MNSRSDVVARVRGCAVGSLSGGVSIAAHGVGGGAAPTDGAIVLLLLVCAAIGVSVGAVRAHVRLPVTAGTLAAGQIIGHTTLSMASDHVHDVLPSTPMLSAHVAALVATALLVLATETSGAHALAALARIVVVTVKPCAVATELWSTTPVCRANVGPSLLAGASVGTRGPPTYV